MPSEEAAMPRIVQPTPVTLDRERTILFTRAAVKNIEIELTKIHGHGFTFYQAIRDLGQMLTDDDLGKLSLVNVGVLLWQGCLHEDPALTLEQVEESLPYGSAVALMPYVLRIFEAWQAASPQAPPTTENEEAVQETDPLDASTGAPSGLLNGPALVSVTPSFGD